jgi:hypothetical protein
VLESKDLELELVALGLMGLELMALGFRGTVGLYRCVSQAVGGGRDQCCPFREEWVWQVLPDGGGVADYGHGGDVSCGRQGSGSQVLGLTRDCGGCWR